MKALAAFILATCALWGQVKTLAPVANQFFVDNSTGVTLPLAGGFVYTYIAGTTTPLATYGNQAGSSTNPNPIVLNSGGYNSAGSGNAGIWLGSSCYKFVVQNSSAVTLYTQDNICDQANHVTAPGATTDVVYNDAGVLGGDANFKWLKTTKFLDVLGDIRADGTGTRGFSQFGAPTLNFPTPVNTTELFALKSTTATPSIWGAQFKAEFDSASNSSNIMYGGQSDVSTGASASGTLAAAVGHYGLVTHKGTGALALAYGVVGTVDAESGAAAITDSAAFGANNPPTASGAGNWNSYSGFWARGGAVGNTIGTRFGLRVDSLTSGTTKWGVYVQTDPSFFGGAVAVDSVTAATKVVNAFHTDAFSATPVFDLSLGDHLIVITGNVTSSTVTNITNGQRVTFSICQDNGGAHTFAWPAVFRGATVIGATDGLCSVQQFEAFDGATLVATAAGVINQ